MSEPGRRAGHPTRGKTQRKFLFSVETTKSISPSAETVTTEYASRPATFVRSPLHSPPTARTTPGCSANADSASASGSSPPAAAHASAASGAVAAALSPSCQQAPAKSRVPSPQPALKPFRRSASAARSALQRRPRLAGAAGGLGVGRARDLAEGRGVDLGADDRARGQPVGRDRSRPQPVAGDRAGNQPVAGQRAGADRVAVDLGRGPDAAAERDEQRQRRRSAVPANVGAIPSQFPSTGQLNQVPQARQTFVPETGTKVCRGPWG